MNDELAAAMPIACDMTVFSASERAAHVALAQKLFTNTVQATRELADGYAFQFAADAYAQVTHFVANERRCCPFLTFVIEVPAQQQALWLRITGDASVKALLETEFQLEQRATTRPLTTDHRPLTTDH